MTTLGQQRPMSDPDARRPLDRVGANPLDDDRRFGDGLALLAESAVRGVVREWRVQTQPPCPRCGCVGTKA